MPQNPFNKGDGISFSIAAASIVAKTHRDALMEEMDTRFPGYGLAKHKGYSTPEHEDAIRRLGPTEIHRTSFTYIKELCGGYSPQFYELKARIEGTGNLVELREVESAVAASRDELGDDEQRKLKLSLARRWKTV